MKSLGLRIISRELSQVRRTKTLEDDEEKKSLENGMENQKNNKNTLL